MIKKEKQKTHLVSVRIPDNIYQSICTEAQKKKTTHTTIINNRLQTPTFYGPEILNAIVRIQNKLESVSDSIDISEEVHDLWQFLK